MGRPQHVTVVGAEGLNQRTSEFHLQSFGWTQLDGISNLSDADTLVFNFLELENPETVDWSVLFQALTPSVSFRDILLHDGRIVFLGDPSFDVKWSNEHAHTDGVPFLWWTGVQFVWDGRSGKSVELLESDSPTSRYLSHLERYQYSLRDCTANLAVLGLEINQDHLQRQGVNLEERVRSLAKNRYGGHLAFAVNFLVLRSGRYGDKSIVGTTGEMLFLPETELGPEDSLLMVLRDVCGVELSVPEPKWVADTIVEGQQGLDVKLREIEAELSRLSKARDKALWERTVIRKPLRLLYDISTGLEGAVLEAFEELGAAVKRPKSPGLEDGWIEVQTDSGILDGVLEVKGTRGRQFKEDGLKQVVTWVNRGIQLEKKRYKGIFIGNSEIEKAPKQRRSAFSSGFVQAATLHELVALKSEDLFRCLQLRRLGKLDIDAFWRGLFNTNGVFDSSICESEEDG